jgi:pyruvate kinase
VIPGAGERLTKILGTIGPASITKLPELIESGLDIARINLSHGDANGHKQAMSAVRRASEGSGRPVGLLIDLSGPKVRLRDVPHGEIQIEAGQGLGLTPNPSPSAENLQIDYPGLSADIDPGDSLLLADGTVELRVLECGDPIKTVVVRGGTLRSRAGLNVPSEKLSLPAITDKDRDDVSSFGPQNADWIAQSFVRKARDIHELRRLVDGRRIVAKIETGSAIEDADAIIDAADAIMVARGDLGVEIPFEAIPGIQKDLVRKSGDAGKPVIVATQMLESMITSFRPTRAEATDVANAVFDGADAIMLSAETAIGAHPIEAIKVAAKIAAAAEKHGIQSWDRRMGRPTSEPQAIAQAASMMASRDPDIAAISCFTSSGRTAELLSAVKPGIPIYAYSDDADVVNSLTLRRAIVARVCEEPSNTDEMIAIMDGRLKEAGLRPGTRVLMAASIPVGKAGTNLLKTHEL